MRGLDSEVPFLVCFSVLLLGYALHSLVVVGLGLITLGAWVVLMTWWYTDNEERAFEMAQRERFLQRAFRWGWPFTLFQGELTRSDFHREYVDRRWLRIIGGYLAGAGIIACGIWFMLRPGGG